MIIKEQETYIKDIMTDVINEWGKGYKYFVEAIPVDVVLSSIGWFVHNPGISEHKPHSFLFNRTEENGTIIACCLMLNDKNFLDISNERISIFNITKDVKDKDKECYLWKIKCDFRDIVKVMDLIGKEICDKVR